VVAALGRVKAVTARDAEIPATGCGGGPAASPVLLSPDSGVGGGGAAPAFFDAARRAVVIPVAGRALSVLPARGPVAAALLAALTPEEDAAITAALRAAWGFS